MAKAERTVLSPRITYRGNLRSTRHGWLSHRFVNVKTRVLRRRTSKKELFE